MNLPCVYVLISLKDSKRYIGSTINLERRLYEHLGGEVQSTKNRRPLILKYRQICESLVQARLLELKYKRSRGTYDRAIRDGLLEDCTYSGSGVVAAR